MIHAVGRKLLQDMAQLYVIRSAKSCYPNNKINSEDPLRKLILLTSGVPNHRKNMQLAVWGKASFIPSKTSTEKNIIGERNIMLIINAFVIRLQRESREVK